MTVTSLDEYRAKREPEREAAKLRHPSSARQSIIAERLKEMDEQRNPEGDKNV